MLSEIGFQGAWRDYQQRVLDALDGHLDDSRLHVVAAPGSGKTILGLEVLRRIGRPALVLAPSIAIRNQWVERLCGLFLPAGAARPGWISTSLARPAALTVATYQALFAALDEDEPAALGALAAFYGGESGATLVLDEAHHLRKEWWRSLTALRSALPGLRIVALTATPPYDVPLQEWQRYEALCGAIDAEIPIPELVRNGDLCPHQDHVHFSMPTEAEDALIAARRDGLAGFISALQVDAGFLGAILAHPWLVDPAAHEEAILDAPEFLSSMLIFARFAGAAPPVEPMRLLAIGTSEIPPLSLEWLEILLDNMLFDRSEGFADEAARLKALRAELRRLGAIEGRRVRLIGDRSSYTTLAGSLAKIGSVAAIAEAEAAALGEDLRLVVLADYVRADDLGHAVQPAKLGVVPIFEALRRRALPGVKLGVLTGTLVAIPAAAGDALRRAAALAGLDPADVRTRPLDHDPGFLRLDLAGEAGQRIVHLVTLLFDAGDINLLVGTQALLGEGWDAPTLNALVLASYVGSYMLSNQMRGRAIRTDPARPGKTANIWHLATVVPERALLPGGPAAGDPFDPVGRELGPDMAMLKRRFLAFEGVAHGGAPRIETGLGRLALAGRAWDEESVRALNAEMLERAGGRAALAGCWRDALGGASRSPRMHRAARVTHRPRTIAFLDTLQYLAITGLLGGFAAAARAMLDPRLPGAISTLVWIFLGLGFLYALPKLARALYLLARNGTVEGSLGQVGAAVLDGLDKADALAGPRETLTVAVERGMLGERLIRLDGGTRADERQFLDALAEVLGPIGNPRYLIRRSSWLGRWRRIDYHAVPARLGRNEQLAAYFAARWNRRIGGGRLIYLRTAEGRRLLLRARARSLAAGFQRFVGALGVWR